MSTNSSSTPPQQQPFFFNNTSNEEQVASSKATESASGWKPLSSRRPSVLPHYHSSPEVVSHSSDLFSYAFPAPLAPNSSPPLLPNATAAAPWSSSSSITNYNNIASVPMLPEVSEEPFYREQRSMSYSLGAPSSVFSNNYKFSPTPASFVPTNTNIMQDLNEEEEEEDDYVQQDEEMLRSAYIRTRSKSTAAVMVAGGDIWNPQKKEIDDAKWFAAHNQRRSSLISQNTTVFPPMPMMSTSSSTSTTTAAGNGGMRRFSLAPPSMYPIENNNSSAPLFYNNQRRHSLAGPTATNTFFPYNDTNNPSTMMNSISEIESLSIRENHAAAAAPIEFNKMDDMGKGTRLDLLLSTTCFYVVEFKGGRSDVFYNNQLPYKRNELVIVEADRGRDLGKIKQENISREQLEIYYVQLKTAASHANGVDQEDLQAEVKTSYAPNEIYIKSIYRTATRDEITLFMAKGQDESKALMVCQSKIKQKKLNMQVVDAEYQWDRRKLTFYFIAEKRVDFRELVRELFKLYKTRIWMCAVNSIKVLE